MRGPAFFAGFPRRKRNRPKIIGNMKLRAKMRTTKRAKWFMESLWSRVCFQVLTESTVGVSATLQNLIFLGARKKYTAPDRSCASNRFPQTDAKVAELLPACRQG